MSKPVNKLMPVKATHKMRMKGYPPRLGDVLTIRDMGDLWARMAAHSPEISEQSQPISDSSAAPCRTASAVAADIARRAELGIAKYGTTVADNPLSRREWLQHAYEEALDMAVYLRRLIDLELGQ